MLVQLGRKDVSNEACVSLLLRKTWLDFMSMFESHLHGDWFNR